MKRAGAGGFSAVCRAAGASRAATRPDPGARVGEKRRVLLELQWQGRGGKFRHVVVSRRGLRQVLGTSAMVALFALAVVGAFSVRSTRAMGHLGADTAMRESTELNVRHDALREEAFDLADQLYGRIEQGRRMLRMAGSPVHAWEGQCPRPPARDAGDDAILAWLSEQGTRLEAIGNELTAGRVEIGGKQASAPAPANGRTSPVRDAAVLQMADMGSSRR
jgi:hypothetical protein